MAEIKKKKTSWTRRAFMAAGGVLGAGLVVGVGGMAYVNRKIQQYSGTGMGDGASLNAWIRIAPDNSITLAIPRAEMGQGVYTSLPAMIAEELEIELENIEVMHPQPESPYANVFMVTQQPPNFFEGYSMQQKMFAFMTLVGTGGSTSISDGFYNMRYAGATAREMLRTAAANRWGVDVSQTEVRNRTVVHKGDGTAFTYGELAAEAAMVELDALPALKEKSAWTKIGKPVQRLDIPDKVNGKAEFGIDVRLDNMLYAAVRYPGVVGGKITGITNQAEIEGMAGVEKVVLTDFGAAVIANNTWRARNAAAALTLQEENAGNANLSTDTINKQLETVMAAGEATLHEDVGDTDASFADATGTLVEATYHVPYLAHATMEPMNCTVLYDEGEVELWTGHQAISVVQEQVAKVTGVSPENIHINTTYLGGGFGRRGEFDYVTIASAVAKELPGRPVMTVFSREADMQNDFYRPAATSAFRALVDDEGGLTAWENHVVQQPVGYQAMKRLAPGIPVSKEHDEPSTEGARGLPYAMNNCRVKYSHVDLPLPIGFWRSVGSSQNGFFTECFVDECAHAAGIDPYLFRKSKLGNHPRFEKVLDRVAEMSNWGGELPEGTFQGIALHKSFGSIVGQVAQITRVDEKKYSIDKFFCAIDCGIYINPDTVAAQMEGGLIFGLSAALYGEITWKDGAVQQTNFPTYDMVRLNVAPRVEVAIMENDEYPGERVGEPGTPPAAPALVNAIFAASGVRERVLPLRKQGYVFV